METDHIFRLHSTLERFIALKTLKEVKVRIHCFQFVLLMVDNGFRCVSSPDYSGHTVNINTVILVNFKVFLYFTLKETDPFHLFGACGYNTMSTDAV